MHVCRDIEECQHCVCKVCIWFLNRGFCCSACVSPQVTFKRVEDPKEAGLQLEMLKDYGYGERGSDVYPCGLLWGGGLLV
jgi:hypothetical protein